MSRRTWFTAGWLVWIAALVALEGVALLNHEDGDTLSENVWWFFHVFDPHPSALVIGGRVVLGVFLAWLFFHFVFGWFTPTRPLPGRSIMTAPVPASHVSHLDAFNRAARTFAQGLLVDVSTAVVLVAGQQLGELHWTRAYWVALGTLLIKTAVSTAVAYVYRRLRPPVALPPAISSKAP